ncbi:MAG: TetR/AcrR family transcriptional regulator [Oscillospiraceae bacterium]|nr:TetR/AcrR family transcriptional regulator [Oscillospiraceae bacterium]
MTEGHRKNKKQELLLAGVQELNDHGIVDFSVRRVAEACGLSPAAPYKHFANKNEFIAAVISYNYSIWYTKLHDILEANPGDYRRQITEMLVTYTCFLVENPHFRSALMIKDDALDRGHQGLRSKLSKLPNEAAEKYREQVNMPMDVFVRKKFVLRSLMYGAALMFENGELAYNEESLEMLRAMADREFDIP